MALPDPRRSDIVSIAFLRIDLEGEDAFKISTAAGSPYSQHSEWSDYEGVGSVFTLSTVRNTTSTDGSAFQATLSLPRAEDELYDLTDFFTEIRTRDLQNKPVCIHMADITPQHTPDPNNPGSTAYLPQPYLVLLGRVNRIDVSPSAVVCHIFTPADILNKVVGAPASLSDFEQRRHVDAGDYAFQFITDTNADVIFP